MCVWGGVQPRSVALGLGLLHLTPLHCVSLTPSPQHTHNTHDTHARAQVDKKLLGGFVLEFEDRLVDMSVAKKLEEFNNLVFKLEGDLRG